MQVIPFPVEATKRYQKLAENQQVLSESPSAELMDIAEKAINQIALEISFHSDSQCQVTLRQKLITVLDQLADVGDDLRMASSGYKKID